MRKKEFGWTRRQAMVGAATSAVSGVGLCGTIVAVAARGHELSEQPIKAVRVGTPIVVPDNTGDTWVAAWADDGSLYTPSNDTGGFHSKEVLIDLLPELSPEQKARLKNDDESVWKETSEEQQRRIREQGPVSTIAFNRVFGSDPLTLAGETINWMKDFSAQDRGGREVIDYFGKRTETSADGCTWKSSGCAFIDGALCWVIARHTYGELSGDPHLRQTAVNASLIKSTDYGKTWSRSAEENLRTPMFPGSQFSAPYFIDYGRNRIAADGADRFVYAISNNGFWDNGDRLILGRIPRERIGLLSGADWEFLAAPNGSTESWTSQVTKARPILERAGSFGMSGVAYLPARGRYMLIGWHYPAGGGKIKDAHTKTMWEFYESPKPWGPWTRIGSQVWSPQGYYCPCICPRFQSADRIYVVTAGDWTNSSVYRLTLVPVGLV